MTATKSCASREPDALAIREVAQELSARYAGGRFRVEEWRIGEEWTLKVVLVWKYRRQRDNGSP